MTKAEFVKQLKEEARLASLAQAENAYNTLFSLLAETLKKGNNVFISGFSSFKTVKRAARKGRNPRSGVEIKIPESTAVKFTPSKALKENL
jgi:DNA-binding protein HU-beta